MRRSKRWAELTRKTAISLLITGLLFKLRWKEKLLVENNEELYKPFSFAIDGPEPFQMTPEQWGTIQEHYMEWNYR